MIRYSQIRARHQRHRRIRSRVRGTAERPRASVYRSLRRLSVQLIDDAQGQSLLAVYGESQPGLTKTGQAKAVGQKVAKLAQAKGISQIVFDRSGWAYRGRIQALAEAMREGGLVF